MPKKITVEEVRHILFKDLNSKKSPGNDGITVGLLQSKWELLEPYFMDCIETAIEHGELAPSQKQGVVKLIEKKGKIVEYWTIGVQFHYSILIPRFTLRY